VAALRSETGHAPRAAPPNERASSEQDELDGEIARCLRRAELLFAHEPPKAAAVESCHWVPEGCPNDEGERSCLEIGFDLGVECRLDARDEEALAALAEEVRTRPRLEKLRIVGPSRACVALVRGTLERDGVDRARLETEIRDAVRYYTHFEVAAWDGVRCKW
jgi:hypothetical protein